MSSKQAKKVNKEVAAAIREYLKSGIGHRPPLEGWANKLDPPPPPKRTYWQNKFGDIGYTLDGKPFSERGWDEQVEIVPAGFVAKVYEAHWEAGLSPQRVDEALTAAIDMLEKEP
jgi:hypothetical protein